LRLSGFGFRVAGLGFGVSGFGFRVLGFGFRVSGFGCWVHGVTFAPIINFDTGEILAGTSNAFPGRRGLVEAGVLWREAETQGARL